MADRPIIFRPYQVRAAHDGRLSQVRSILKPPACIAKSDDPNHWDVSNAKAGGIDFVYWPADDAKIVRRPFPYAVGDRLWVRESHRFRGADYGDSGGDIEWFRCYSSTGAADSWDPQFPDGWDPSRHMKVRELTEPDEQEGDGVTGYATKLLPSIHMPRWASRLTLIVESVRVERLQDISEEDALAEGVQLDPGPCDHPRHTCEEIGCDGGTAVGAFRVLWNSINGPDAWSTNLWVVAVSFRVIRANIDTLGSRDGLEDSAHG